MRFLQNIWYLAAWSEDVGRQPVARRIIDTPLVLYRTESGEVTALADMCPHRFTPLSMGKLVGDRIECLYHGLQFDRTGACVHNPHSATIPSAAVVRRFPAAEYDGLVWVWMGEASAADESKIVRFPMLGQPDTFDYTVGQTMDMPLSYELMTDNLMDLSHVAFTHATTLGTEGLVPGETEVREEGDAIWSMRLGRNTRPAACFSDSGACSPDDLIDYWLDIRWNAPASFYLSAGHAEAGAGRGIGAELSSVQILTPASENRTYYFFKHFRNYGRGDEELTRGIAEGIRSAFAAEDEPMIAQVQSRMDGREFWSMKPILLACDAAPVRVRRAREKLLDAEAAALVTRSAIAAE